MNNRVSLKISTEGRDFLDRLRTNRRTTGTDKRDLGYPQLVEVIYRYFKKNDKYYKELLKEEYVKDV